MAKEPFKDPTVRPRRTERDIQKDFDDYKDRIFEQGDGNPGGQRVLMELLREKGPQIFDQVAPNLGKGGEIWNKYNDECGEDLDLLVERYSK